MSGGRHRGKKVIHYPSLETILMVEELVKKRSGELTRTQLWKALPKGVMYQTFRLILDYLGNSGKVSVHKDGSVVWVHDPYGQHKIGASWCARCSGMWKGH